jgi:Berberine and berberine like
MLLSSEWTRPEDRAGGAMGGGVRRCTAPMGAPRLREYIPPSTPERIREIYGVNYPRLARIKAQADPANLFWANQNVLPEARG